MATANSTFNHAFAYQAQNTRYADIVRHVELSVMFPSQCDFSGVVGGGEGERTSATCSILVTTKIKNGKKASSTSDRSVTPHCTKHDTLQKVVYHIRFTQFNCTLKLFTYYHIQVHRVLTSVYCYVYLKRSLPQHHGVKINKPKENPHNTQRRRLHCDYQYVHLLVIPKVKKSKTCDCIWEKKIQTHKD